MKKYIISPVTTFDEDEELFLTKVGLDAPGMPLHYIVCAKTELQSRVMANLLVSILEKK